MTPAALAAAGFAGGFLCGSVPFGLLIGRARGVDLRGVGSGNIGAANALRALGRGPAAATLALDALKGALPVAVVLAAGGGPPEARPAAALWTAGGALLGHCFTPWLRGRGGKGVATSLGALLALWWPGGLLALAGYALALRATRVSAVGSLCGAAIGAAALGYARGAAGRTYGLIALALLVFTHRDNLARLRAGRELRLGPEAAAARKVPGGE